MVCLLSLVVVAICILVFYYYIISICCGRVVCAVVLLAGRWRSRSARCRRLCLLPGRSVVGRSCFQECDTFLDCDRDILIENSVFSQLWCFIRV